MALENPFQSKGSYQSTHKINGIQALHDHVIVRDMDFSGRKLASGILLLGDDGKTDGIRPRWGKVYAVGPDQKDVQVGQWILLEHGRWSRGLKVEIDNEQFVIRRADINAMLFVSDVEPTDESVSTALHAERKTRE